ncbi:hypothetical protein E3A20_21100, partial [Planctomyces bekefii]
MLSNRWRLSNLTQFIAAERWKQLDLGRALFFLCLLELVLGGAGTLTPVAGAFTLRMLFFLLALFYSLILVLKAHPIRRDSFTLFGAHTFLLTTGVLCGLVNGAPSAAVFLDVKPLVFFYVLVFFELTVKTKADVETVGRLLQRCAMIMATAYLVYVASMRSGLIYWPRFYEYMSDFGEFAFRDDRGFFYKGFLYLCIGVFFSFDKRRILTAGRILLVFTAIFLTST